MKYIKILSLIFSIIFIMSTIANAQSHATLTDASLYQNASHGIDGITPIGVRNNKHHAVSDGTRDHDPIHLIDLQLDNDLIRKNWRKGRHKHKV